MTEVPNWFLWVNLAAIFLGPVFAVLVAQYLSRKSNSYDRRMSVFRDLMKYRRSVLSPEYVGALNLVEVEFNKFPAVIAKWRDLYEHLYSPTHKDASYDALRAWNEKTDRLHTVLIHAIARSARLPIEQLDIVAGYMPKAWEDKENLGNNIQTALLAILQGRSVLKIAPGDKVEPHNPFPPPP